MTSAETQARRLLDAYTQETRPFFVSHKLAGLEALDRLAQLVSRALERRRGVTVGFVGESQVGKSTLINALLDRNALPSGGLGPLTAQATRVSYGDVNTLKVEFHGAQELKTLRFLLESYLHRRGELDRVDEEQDAAPAAAKLAAIEQELPADADTGAAAPAHGKPSTLGEHMLGQARLLLLGRKPDRDLPRVALLDGIRAILGLAARGTTDLGFLAERITAIRARLGKQTQLTESSSGQKAFNAALREHVVDWLSPLVRSLDLRLTNDMLRDTTIVDLPGVGVVGDPAAHVAEEFVRREGDALAIVTTNRGITTPLAHLLESSGVITKLLFGGRDGVAPIQVLLAITHLDDVTKTHYQERRQEALDEGTTPPKKEEVFADLAVGMESKARSMVGHMLRQSEAFRGLDETLKARREEVVDRLTKALKVVCVDAPDYIALTYGNTPDDAFLKNEESTRIPLLRNAITGMAADAQRRREYAILSTTNAFRTGIIEHLNAFSRVLERSQGKASPEWARFRADLEARAGELRKATLSARADANALVARTLPGVIRSVCEHAAQIAQARLTALAAQAARINYQTLNAALRRSGVYEAGGLDFPGSICRSLVDVVASEWEPKVVGGLRTAIRSLANEEIEQVRLLCVAAQQRGRSSLADEVLGDQERLLKEAAVGAVAWTEDRLEELREAIQTELGAAVMGPIDAACQQAVRQGINKGTGARGRIAAEFLSGGGRAIGEGRLVAEKLLLQEYAKLVEQLVDGYLSPKHDPLGSALAALTETQAAAAAERARLTSAVQNMARKLVAGGDEAKPTEGSTPKPTETLKKSASSAAIKVTPAVVLGTKAPAPTPVRVPPPAAAPAAASPRPTESVPRRVVVTQAPATAARPPAPTAPASTPAAGTRPTVKIQARTPESALSRRLTLSPVWQEQQSKLPPRLQVPVLLSVINALAGPRSLGFAEVARAAGIEARNVHGFVAEAARVLNVEGQEVIKSERQSERVFLDVPLLEQLFELPTA